MCRSSQQTKANCHVTSLNTLIGVIIAAVFLITKVSLSMSAENSINGYLIKNVSPSEWWIVDSSGEKVAGPFTSEHAAVEVASVFQDQPEPPARRRNSKS